MNKRASTVIVAETLPAESLLAQHVVDGDYTDCFAATVAGEVALEAYISAFYNSLAFRFERTGLGLIGRGANAEDVAALAGGHSDSFAAWAVEARTSDEILLRDFMGQTRSWLKVEPDQHGTRLLFGSGVGRSPDDGTQSTIGRSIFAGLMPAHRFYARRLLAGAVRGLG